MLGQLLTPPQRADGTALGHWTAVRSAPEAGLATVAVIIPAPRRAAQSSRAEARARDCSPSRLPPPLLQRTRCWRCSPATEEGCASHLPAGRERADLPRHRRGLQVARRGEAGVDALQNGWIVPVKHSLRAGQGSIASCLHILTVSRGAPAAGAQHKSDIVFSSSPPGVPTRVQAQRQLHKLIAASRELPPACAHHSCFYFCHPRHPGSHPRLGTNAKHRW